MPKFYCSHCGQSIDGPDELAGQKANCPTCNAEIQVPIIKNLENEAPEFFLGASKKSKEVNTSKGFLDNNIWFTISWVFIYGLCLSIFRPSSPYEKMGINPRNFLTTIFEALGVFIGLSLVALLISLIIAGLIYVNKKIFFIPLSKYFKINLIVITFLSFLVNGYNMLNR